MILFFSGTGNSAYAAKKIAEKTDDQTIDLFERIRGENHAELRSERPWVIVVPTYAWRIPRMVEEWLKNTRLSGNRDVYFVMTCGGSIGNAGKYLKKLCEKKNLRYLGCAEIVMPENYVALFSTPSREEALEIIRSAEPEIEKTALAILRGDNLSQKKIKFSDRLSSGIVNSLFYPLFVHAKKFHATDACVSCGKCVNVCPLNNIRLESGKPAWGKECTHCMACIGRCPTQAIEYGKHSAGKPRYVCPKEK